MSIKPLPHDSSLEESIAWYLIVFWNEAEDIFLELQIEYFYDSQVKEIVEKMYEMVIWGEKIDFVSINSYFPNKTMFLSELCDKCSSFSIYNQIQKLREMYQRRNIILDARRLENLAYSQEELEESIFWVFDRINNTLKDWKSWIEDTNILINRFEKYLEENKNKKITWVSWGNEWLDEHTWGIRNWKTYRIWGLSWAGKTSFIYEIIVNLLKEKKKILFFTLENASETTFENILSSVQEVNPKSIQKWFEIPYIQYLRENTHNLRVAENIFNLSEIKREILKHKPDVVILDYIGLVNIKWYDEKTKYDKYADEVKEFVQKHKDMAWIDLSNLNKSDNEATIREYKGFNGSAKLRNNTDFGMHIFPYKAFAEHKNKIMNIWSEEAKKPYYGKKALTFLISKNRLWDDDIQKHYVIDFNKWIRFVPATEEQINRWENSL